MVNIEVDYDRNTVQVQEQYGGYAAEDVPVGHEVQHGRVANRKFVNQRRSGEKGK